MPSSSDHNSLVYNSSSKIEEVPEGRRSMITQNKLTIIVFNIFSVFILPLAPSILEGGTAAKVITSHLCITPPLR
jgi:hypothetical protein